MHNRGLRCIDFTTTYTGPGQTPMLTVAIQDQRPATRRYVARYFSLIIVGSFSVGEMRS